MPVFHALTGSPASTGVGHSEPTDAGGLQPSRSNFRGNFFSAQTTTAVVDDKSREWGPLPTDDRNRPGGSSSTVVVYPYATPVFDRPLPASTQADSITTAELVGITISAGVVAFTILFSVIWWIRRRGRIGHRLENGSQQSLVVEKGEEPPTYEAAVFGIHRAALPQPSSSSDPQPALQSPPAVHHIHSPRPFNAASSNRTLHQLDLDPIAPRNTVEIVVYPHDSPPPPSERSTLSIRSALQMSPDFENNTISSSYHITDFTEEYPSIMPTDSGMNEREVVAREIV